MHDQVSWNDLRIDPGTISRGATNGSYAGREMAGHNREADISRVAKLPPRLWIFNFSVALALAIFLPLARVSHEGWIFTIAVALPRLHKPQLNLVHRPQRLPRSQLSNTLSNNAPANSQNLRPWLCAFNVSIPGSLLLARSKSQTTTR